VQILLVGTLENGGGAAAVSDALHRGYRARGHVAWRAVGQKTSADPTVFQIPDDDRAGFRATGYTAIQNQLRRLAGQHPGQGWGLLRRSLRRVTHPVVWRQEQQGIEDFEFPGSHHLLDHLPAPPDVVHCHNLHGGFFDLRALPEISRRVPTVLTLHDAWMLSGHCAHSLGCDRWKTGCGSCPDLLLYPAVRRDATAENWQRKRDVYSRSRLYIASPSRWLADRVEQSMLKPAVAGLRVIPNGVDLSVFRPADKKAVRAQLGLPADAVIVLLTAGSHYSVWKDRRTMNHAMAAIIERTRGREVIFLALEDPGGPAFSKAPDVRFAGYQSKPADLARFHQAADIYVHAARADTFPTAVLEALACGTPVVATRVGGIPEQIIPATTGILVEPEDAAAMANGVVTLIEQGAMRRAMGEQAAHDAARRFDERRQIDDYLDWYRDARADWQARRAHDGN
jgi:glycosyltransferase involved in cell wall biosynthesis